MQGRLGIYDKKPFDPNSNSIEGLAHQAELLKVKGGNR